MASEKRTEYRVVTTTKSGYTGTSAHPTLSLAAAIEARDYFPKGVARVQSRTITETPWTDHEELHTDE